MGIRNDRKVETTYTGNQDSSNVGVQSQGKLNGKKVWNLASFLLGKTINKTIQKEASAYQRQYNADAGLKDTAKKLVELVKAGKLAPEKALENLDSNISTILENHEVATKDYYVEHNKLAKLATLGLILVGKFSKAKAMSNKILDKAGLQQNIDQDARIKKEGIRSGIAEQISELQNLAKAEELSEEEKVEKETPSKEGGESLMDRLNKLTNDDQKI